MPARATRAAAGELDGDANLLGLRSVDSAPRGKAARVSLVLADNQLARGRFHGVFSIATQAERCHGVRNLQGWWRIVQMEVQVQMKRTRKGQVWVCTRFAWGGCVYWDVAMNNSW